jgi:hypothetical protein
MVLEVIYCNLRREYDNFVTRLLLYRKHNAHLLYTTVCMVLEVIYCNLQREYDKIVTRLLQYSTHSADLI